MHTQRNEGGFSVAALDGCSYYPTVVTFHHLIGRLEQSSDTSIRHRWHTWPLSRSSGRLSLNTKRASTAAAADRLSRCCDQLQVGRYFQARGESRPMELPFRWPDLCADCLSHFSQTVCGETVERSSLTGSLLSTRPDPTHTGVTCREINDVARVTDSNRLSESRRSPRMLVVPFKGHSDLLGVLNVRSKILNSSSELMSLLCVKKNLTVSTIILRRLSRFYVLSHILRHNLSSAMSGLYIQVICYYKL